MRSPTSLSTRTKRRARDLDLIQKPSAPLGRAELCACRTVFTTPRGPGRRGSSRDADWPRSDRRSVGGSIAWFWAWNGNRSQNVGIDVARSVEPSPVFVFDRYLRFRVELSSGHGLPSSVSTACHLAGLPSRPPRPICYWMEDELTPGKPSSCSARLLAASSAPFCRRALASSRVAVPLSREPFRLLFASTLPPSASKRNSLDLCKTETRRTHCSQKSGEAHRPRCSPANYLFHSTRDEKKPSKERHSVGIKRVSKTSTRSLKQLSDVDSPPQHLSLVTPPRN